MLAYLQSLFDLKDVNTSVYKSAGRKSPPLLCFGFPKWEGDYMTSTVQLLSELAMYHEVLYVEYPFTLTDLWRGRAPARRLLGLEPRQRSVSLPNGAGLHVLTLPPFLPANWTPSTNWHLQLMRWNSRLARSVVRPALRRLGFERPVVVNAFQPALGSLLRGAFNERLLLYYCYDEISAAPWIKKHGAISERRFLPQADAVITSSRQLAGAKRAGNACCYTVLNGVDDQRFRPLALSGEAPFEAAGYRAVVGYLGSVDLRLNYQLLGEVIARCPEYLFIFVGRVNHPGGQGQLDSFDNVRLLGSQPPDSLPHFVQHFDLGIIPFLDNELTAGIYPLKVNEYLAMGKPVVATTFGDMSDFREHIQLADNAEAFRKAIVRALAENHPEEREQRIAFARQNSWRKRAEQLHELIMRLTTEKSDRN